MLDDEGQERVLILDGAAEMRLLAERARNWNGWVSLISVLAGTTSYGTLAPFARRLGQSEHDPHEGSGHGGPRAGEPRDRTVHGNPSGHL